MTDEPFEERLEQRLTLLVEKKLKSIKLQLGKLTGRVEQMELMDFQDQLNRLNERITKFSDDLTEIKRMLFKHQLMLLRDYFRGIMHRTGHVAASPPTWTQAEDDCFSEIMIYYAQTRERINHCKDMEDMEKAFNNFWNKTNDFLLKHGFPKMTKLE